MEGVGLGYERREIGGLPAYVADRAGPAAAALVFRAGQADEPLARRGLMHLVEHLVLGAAGETDAVSGHVDLLSTLLAVEGSPKLVSEHLRRIGASIASPPVDRLDLERRVLSVEAGAGTSGGAAVLVELFYGARGPGVAAYAELGLRDARPADVVEHARTWFCDGNAALVVVGPVDGLEDLGLPPGPRRAPASPVMRSHPVLPAEIAQIGSPLALGAPLETSPAVVLLAAVLERRTWAALRRDRGLAYHVDCRARRVGPEERLLVLTTDVEAQDAGAAAEAMVAQVRRLAAGELDEGELEQAVAGVTERIERAGPLEVLSAAAVVELVTGRSRLPAAALDDIRAVTRAGVIEAANALSARMILACPAGTSSNALPVMDPPAGPALAGRRHRRRRLSRHLHPVDVVVGDEGVSAIVDDPDGTVVTVRYAACVAVVREIDGGLTLIEDSGSAVTVDPGDIQDGREAVARIERAVDPGLLVSADERVQRVQAGASRPLRPLVVGEASELLAPLLGRDEHLVLATEAMRGVRSGVLAVTDRRLLFVAKLFSEYVEEIALADVEHVSTRRNPLSPAVTIAHRDGRTRIGFITVPRALEAAQAIRSALRPPG